MTLEQMVPNGYRIEESGKWWVAYAPSGDPIARNSYRVCLEECHKHAALNEKEATR